MLKEHIGGFFLVETELLKPPKINIFPILEQSLNGLCDGDLLFITTKILSLHQGRCVPCGSANKDELAKSYSQYYLPRDKHANYPTTLAIVSNCLMPSAGIDESNSDGHLILWPINIGTLLAEIRDFLLEKFSIKRLGIVATDSRSNILQLGTSGIAVACCGFNPLRNYLGTEDLFGRSFVATRVNIAQSLASTAVLFMGEGSERTPMAIYRPNMPSFHSGDVSGATVAGQDAPTETCSHGRSVHAPGKNGLDIEYIDTSFEQEMTIDKLSDDIFFPLLKPFINCSNDR